MSSVVYSMFLNVLLKYKNMFFMFSVPKYMFLTTMNTINTTSTQAACIDSPLSPSTTPSLFHSRGPIYKISYDLSIYRKIILTSPAGCLPRKPPRIAPASAVLNNMNRNNDQDKVYGAVIMTEVIARVHPVHLMNVD